MIGIIVKFIVAIAFFATAMTVIAKAEMEDWMDEYEEMVKESLK